MGKGKKTTHGNKGIKATNTSVKWESLNALKKRMIEADLISADDFDKYIKAGEGKYWEVKKRNNIMMIKRYPPIEMIERVAGRDIARKIKNGEIKIPPEALLSAEVLAHHIGEKYK